ncbi:MAG TPA: MerR family transcriptional regulator [Bryobacteraceae bacterium]
MSEIPPNRDDMAAAPEIPDKLFFRIGEVSHIVGVEAYVLRYWESEFPGLSPRKSSTGQRMFRRKDVELLLRIKHLLYGQKFTIEGARKALQEKALQEKSKAARPVAQPAQQPSLFAPSPLPEIRRQVQEILQLLTQTEAA